MLITREVDYGLRILRTLSTGEQLSTGEICEKEFLPKQFAYKIIKKLAKAEIISIARGAEGGNRLNISLDQITLYDLMEILDSTKFVNACMASGYSCPWKEANSSKCNIHENLNVIQKSLTKEVKSHTISSLIK